MNIIIIILIIIAAIILLAIGYVSIAFVLICMGMNSRNEEEKEFLSHYKRDNDEEL